MRSARSWLSAVTLVAVALATLLGGQRYFYCRAMDQIMSHPTCECAQAHNDELDCVAINAANDCFEVRSLHRLVSFTVGSDLGVPAAGLVGVLPAFDPEFPSSKGVVMGAEHPIRAGPYSPAAARANLMVFLT
jgi:hypothetical protein